MILFTFSQGSSLVGEDSKEKEKSRECFSSANHPCYLERQRYHVLSALVGNATYNIFTPSSHMSKVNNRFFKPTMNSIKGIANNYCKLTASVCMGWTANSSPAISAGHTSLKTTPHSSTYR